LSLLEVQKEGKKRMEISEFLRGFSIMPGDLFQ
jgi:methionyl-tRNA formyltransferase